MPRRTRRSDAPSATGQSDVDNDGSTPLDTPADQSPLDPTVPKRTRIPAPRRKPLIAADTAGETGEALPLNETVDVPGEQVTSRPRRRRPLRGAIKSAGLSAEAAEADTSEQLDQESSHFVIPDLASDASNPDKGDSALRRRVGGRRSASEAAAAAAGGSPDVANATPSPVEDVPTRSRRNRRRKGSSSPVESSVEPADTQSDVSELDNSGVVFDLPLIIEPVPAEESVTDEEQRRSRRSRRGGRRRSGRNTDTEKAAETETDSSTEEVEDDDPLVPLFKPTPVWKAPSLVPHPSELGLEPVKVRVSAKLAADLEGFEINGVFVAPEMFFVNGETADDPTIVASEIGLAAAVGLHLHSGVAYLPLKNAFGARSFASVEALLSTVLSADPEGYVVIRLQLVPTNFWARTHPDEMAKYSDGSDGDVSFASTAFWQDTVEAIDALLQHLADENTLGGDRVIGIHLDKGEWFNDANTGYDLSKPNKLFFQSWLHEQYQSVYALRAAWFNGSAEFETAEIPKWPGAPNSRKREEVVLYNQPRERRFVDYNSYTSDVMAHAICGVAKAVKWLSSNQLLVGTSYGYTFEFGTRNDSGHQSLNRVLGSNDIDVIAGPNTYSTRGAGAAGAFGSPVDSARLHSKIWLIEDDTKTYLAADETEDSFNPKVSSHYDTVAVLRRNAASANVHGCGIVWMDLWGKGWLNNSDIWSEIAELRSQAVISRRVRAQHGLAVPEVAILVDEASYAYVRGDGAGVGLQTSLITKSRELVYRSGASVGFYLQSDLSLLPGGIKLYIFLNALRVATVERQAIREKLQKQGKTLVWVYGPGVFDERGESPAEVTEIVGMALKAQPWSSRIGTIFTEERHPITERLHGGKRLGTDEVLNPSYAVVDSAAIVLGEYVQTGAPSISSKINEGGWKSVFVGEPHLTGELLRGIFRFAGIHVYDAQDDVVHCSSSGLMLIHAPYTGQRTIHLPKPSAVYSVYERRLVTQQSSTFRAFMRGRTTNFFLWGDIDQIAATLNTTAEELREQQAAWKAERDANQNRNQRSNESAKFSENDGSDNGADFGASDEQDVLDEPGVQSELTPGLQESHSQLVSARAEVEVLVRNGLIADDSALTDDDFADDAAEEDAAEDGSEPVKQNEPMSPSRRRRWNRKRNMQATREPGAPPSISMEDLLSDLPPRKTGPPRDQE
jgi:hypothetical protein